jgi:hypothetical protein
MPERLRALLPLIRMLGHAWRRASAYYRALREDPAARDRAAAASVFAFIFAFAVVSVDYVITGGPDWNPGAEAAELPAALTAPVALAPPPRFPDAGPPPPLEAPEPVEADYWRTTDDLLGGPETILAAHGAPGAGARATLRVESGKPAEAAVISELSPAQTSKGKS